MSRLRIAAQLACWAAVGLVPLSAHAQSTWLQPAGGTYSWQTAANWSTNPTVPGGAGAVANLTSDIAGNQQVMLDAAVTLGTPGNAPVAPGTDTGGFFIDLPGDFLSSVSGGDFRYWVRGIFGGTQQTFDGVVSSPLSAFDPSLSVTLATAGFAGAAGLRSLVTCLICMATCLPWTLSGRAAARAPFDPPPEPALEQKLARYPVRLREPLRYGDDLVEVTEARTLRRRYRHWGDWDREVADYLAEARRAMQAAGRTPQTIRVGCLFFDDARLVCPKIPGADGKPLEAAYTTPEPFRERMRADTCPRYGDFMEAFSGGEVRLEWTFVTVPGLVWTFDGAKDPAMSFQPRAIGPAFEQALARHATDGIQMWVLCGGTPEPRNPADPKQRVAGPPYGISYTQWKLHQGYSLVVTAPHLALLVHEFNHRYLDNLGSIEGVQLTMFHGLAMLGYEGGDCGYDDLLNTYRSVYQYLIRPAMHRRFTLVAENKTPREPFTGRAYAWAHVAEDLWFRLPEIGSQELATLTGIPSLEIVGDRRERHRLFRVADADRDKVSSPLVPAGGDADTAVNNLLSLATESCAVLATETGHWLVVRPDLADLYVEMGKVSGRGGPPLAAYGWINQGVRPLVVLRADPALGVPDVELEYIRPPGVLR